jgi:hypothetical protein
MEDEWDVVRNDRGGWPSGAAGVGILRIVLLFGSAAVALALIIAPIAENQTRNYANTDRRPLRPRRYGDRQHQPAEPHLHDPPQRAAAFA